MAMNGHRVGTFHQSSGGALTFRYANEWLDGERATPISLSMPLSSQPYRDPVVSNFLDNLLPDDGEVRRLLQASLGTDSSKSFDLLGGAGGDCIGALQIFGTPEMPDVRQVNAVRVSEADIARILRDLGRRPLGLRPSEDRFRISLAGVHDKTALLRLGHEWHRPEGPTPTSHILKLPIGVVRTTGLDLSDSVENEWLCLKIVKAFGLRVPAASIEDFDGVRVLVVERFDREWSEDGSWLVRLPHEDLCQALGFSPGQKYESAGGPGIRSVLDLLLQAAEPDRDRADFFKANVVYWMLAAIDGHAKNFSLALHPGGLCSLAPLYDIVSAYPVVSRGQFHRSKLDQAMSVVGKKKQYAWERIQRRHWLATAKASRLPEEDAEAILTDCVARASGIARDMAAHLPREFPESVAAPVLEGLEAAARRLGTSTLGG